MKVVTSPPLRTGRLYPQGISWYSFLEAESTPGHMELSDAPEKKNPQWPEIDPGTLRLVAQCLNHSATPGPQLRHPTPPLLDVSCEIFWQRWTLQFRCYCSHIRLLFVTTRKTDFPTYITTEYQTLNFSTSQRYRNDPTRCKCVGQFIIPLFLDCSTCFERYYRSSSGASKL